MGRGGGAGGSGRSGGFSSGGSRGFSSRSSGGLRSGSPGGGFSPGRGSSPLGTGSAGRAGTTQGRGAASGAGRGVSSGAGRGFGTGRTPTPGRMNPGSSGRGFAPEPHMAPPPPPPPRRPRPRIWPVFLPLGRTYYGRSYGTTGTTPSGPSVDGDGNYVPPPYGEPTYGEKRGGIPGWYKFLSVILLIVVVILLWNASRAANAAKSAGTARVRLSSDACTTEAQWIGDELDWIHDTKTVTDAMQYFYDETGVQPYLLICDNMDGVGGSITDSQAEASLAALYDSLYRDEGHMIFAFLEYQTSRYITYLYTGVSADTVIDEEAVGIFLDYADRYYTDQSLTDEEYFARIFTESADAIMADPDAESHSAMIYALAAVAVLALLAAGLIAFKIQEKKTEEARELRGILDTPIPKSPEEEELEQKYATNTFTKKGEQ